MNPVPPNPTDNGAVAQPSITPSSEVASGLDSHWRAMFEMQQQNMMQLIEAIRAPAATPKITLPEINPELPDADPRAWCDTIDICLDERPLEGASLIIALSRALKGNASSWLSQISHAGMTWQHFRDLFLARYASTETLAASLVNINNGRPKEGECLAAYASRLMTSLLARWKNRSHEEIATSYVLAHVSQFDTRLNRLAFTSEITSRNKLLQEIKASASLKRKFDRNTGDGATDTKRFKPQASTMFTCHKCGKPGHKAVNCRSKFTQPAGSNVQKTTPALTSSGSSKKITCFRCGETGHISTNCQRGSASGATSSVGSAANAPAERRVDCCEIAGVCGQLEQSVPIYVTATVTAAGVLGGAYLAYRLYQDKPTKLPETWERVGVLKTINVYPVKSCAPVLLNTAECTHMGLRDGWLRDRVLMVVDDKDNFITARGYPELLQVFPTIQNSVLTLKHANLESVSVNLAEVVALGKPKKATVWGEPVTVYDCGWESSEWFSRLIDRTSTNFRLVYYPAEHCRKLRATTNKVYKFTKNDTGALPDETSFNLVNEASVDDLNTRLASDSQVTQRNFRPNFVLSGARPYAEDNWKFVKIGENVFEVIKPCFRCVLTTIDPETGVRNSNSQPLKELKSYRQSEKPEERKSSGDSPRMGLQMALRSGPGGTISLNDPIYVA